LEKRYIMNIYSNLIQPFCFLLLILSSHPSFAQAERQVFKEIVIGIERTRYSHVLEEERRFLIHLPKGYEHSSEKYPVMYVLDGETHFLHASSTTEFLAANHHIPAMIVVAIINTDRTRDFTPYKSYDPSFPSAGKAENFQQFLKEELIPYVESQYRVAPYRLIVGHSFGGLFSIYSLINEPDLFDAYIAISPSLWWDEQRQVEYARDFFQKHTNLKKSVFISIGKESLEMLRGVQQLSQIMRDYQGAGFVSTFQYMDKEDHGSTPNRSIYEGLEFIFYGWHLPLDMQIKGLPKLKTHYAQLSKRFGYEVQPSESLITDMAYTLMGKYQADKAVALLKYNVRLYPNSPWAYNSLGEAYEITGLFRLAIDNYEQAVSKGKKIKDPDIDKYMFNLDKIKRKLGGN